VQVFDFSTMNKGCFAPDAAIQTISVTLSLDLLPNMKVLVIPINVDSVW